MIATKEPMKEKIQIPYKIAFWLFLHIKKKLYQTNLALSTIPKSTTQYFWDLIRRTLHFYIQIQILTLI